MTTDDPRLPGTVLGSGRITVSNHVLVSIEESGGCK